MRSSSNWKRSLGGLVAGVLLGACAAAAPPVPRSVEPPTVSTEAFLARFLEHFDADFRRAVEQRAPLAAVMQAQLAALPAATPGRATASDSDAALLRLVYLGAAPRLRFVGARTGPSKAGELLLRRLRGAAHHALDPARYELPKLEALRAALLQRARDPRLAPPALRERAETLPLWRAIDALGSAGRRAPGARQLLLQRIFEPSGPLPRVAAALVAARAARAAQQVAAVQLELALARAFARYTRELGRANTRPAALPARWSWEASAAGKAWLAKRRNSASSALPATAPLVLRAPAAWLLQEQARDLAAIRDEASLRASLRAAEPPHPQYRKLLAARARYLGYVAAGGWKPLRFRAGLRRGRRQRQVSELRARLLAEGYTAPAAAPGDADLFDDKLGRAIESFQHDHQLKATGHADRDLYRALALGAAAKLAIIERALGGWRRSGVGASSAYVLINVPDFHLEVWQAGKRLARHKIVAGRAQGTKCDEDSRRHVLRYATPLQSARLEYLVVAPYWNVTPEIKQVELDPERAKDGLYYEKNGYEVLRSGTAAEWVRQLPGPGNSLGFVKFIFPNPHATFVHDTPEKYLFDRVLRAHSHGCMRVQDAWGVAKVVLTLAGQWDDRGYQRLYRDWQRMRELRGLRESWDADLYETLREKATKLERKVVLRKPIPVHVEYHTVRVDDGGRLIFLHDIYGLEGRGAGLVDRRVGWRCVPESKLARRGFAELPTKIADLEKRALAVGPLLAQAALTVQVMTRRQRRGNYWLVRQVEKKLGRFSEHHANLVRNIRSDHAELQQALEDGGGRWKGALTKRAVRLLRLLAALSSMTARAEQVGKLAEKLAAKVGASRH